jgi:predicted nuclease of restriction endonuclease-like (RecB) superfamily
VKNPRSRKAAKTSRALVTTKIAAPLPSERRALGRTKGTASFPVGATADELPDEYGYTLRELKIRIQQTRLATVLAANSALVQLYWHVGQTILARQDRAGWGAKVIDRLSQDLRDAFPDMSGWSPRNLKYMRAFAAAWSEPDIVQAPLAQLTWYHQVALIEKLDTKERRAWYARQTVEHGWSRNILAMQIEGRLHERAGRALNNFASTLPPADSDMATQVFKDPYLFDFLGTADPRRELEVEQSLVAHIERFLLELGAGFAFVGRQMVLEVGSQDFKLDLLFYHFRLRRFVVVELKAVPFEPGFVGQLNLYLSAVDDLLKQPGDEPTIGLLLCRSKDKLVVEYALRHLARPVGVAEWETELVDKLPKDLEGSLPTIEQLEAELARTNTDDEARTKLTPRRQAAKRAVARNATAPHGKSTRRGSKHKSRRGNTR